MSNILLSANGYSVVFEIDIGINVAEAVCSVMNAVY
jgi:hypothetical protein